MEARRCSDSPCAQEPKRSNKASIRRVTFAPADSLVISHTVSSSSSDDEADEKIVISAISNQELNQDEDDSKLHGLPGGAMTPPTATDTSDSEDRFGESFGRDGDDEETEAARAMENRFSERAQARRIRRSVTVNFGYSSEETGGEMTLGRSSLWNRRVQSQSAPGSPSDGPAEGSVSDFAIEARSITN